MLPAPGFHHLHLNSVDPDAAIEFYSSARGRKRWRRWEGDQSTVERFTVTFESERG